jgi:hypothetical protein
MMDRRPQVRALVMMDRFTHRVIPVGTIEPTGSSPDARALQHVLRDLQRPPTGAGSISQKFPRPENDSLPPPPPDLTEALYLDAIPIRASAKPHSSR